jgi:hypothetical protein
VVVIVRAQNEAGWDESDPNTSGAIIQTQPLQMSIPSRGSETSQSQIELIWSPIPDANNGGAVVTSYSVQMETAPSTWTGVSLVRSATSAIIKDNITGGQDHNFRIAAINIHGVGQYSSALPVKASGTPDKMNPVTVVRDSSDVSRAKISWEVPNLNHESLAGYIIEVEKSDGIFEAHPDCTPTTSDTSCSISIYSLISSPWNLPAGTQIKVRAKARNTLGPAILYSSVNPSGQLVETVPTKMSTPSLAAGTTETKIAIQFVEIQEAGVDGAVPVTSYHVQKYNDDPLVLDWEDEQGLPPDDSSLTTYSIDVPKDTTLKFRVRAYNIYGPGEFSDELIATTLLVPDQVLGVTTEHQNTNVKIQWTAPADLPGDNSIETTYEIEVQDYNSNYQSELTHCNGNDQNIIDNTECTIPMSAFLAEPFLLQVGDSINARVRAVYDTEPGSYGLGSGASVQTVPSPMTDPRRASGTTTEAIVVEWDQLLYPNTGGSEILSYSLESKTTTGSWTTLTGLTQDQTNTYLSVSVVESGETSLFFRIRARNKYGFGEYSSIVAIKASSAPDKVDMPDARWVSISDTEAGIEISWNAPSSNNEPITAYSVEIADNNSTFDESSECNGSSDAIKSSRTCTVSATELEGPNFLLEFRDPIHIKVKAQNIHDWGDFSYENTALQIQRAPSAVSNVDRGPATTSNQIQITWDALTTNDEIGDSSILAYNVEREVTTGSWESV